MKKILVVDDERMNLKAIKLLLKYKRKDLKVETTATFDEAVKRLSKKDIDVVLADVNLSPGYGPDLKKLYPTVPFIYSTGDWNFKPTDGSAVLHKPYDNTALSDTINIVMGESTSVLGEVLSICAGETSLDAAIVNLIGGSRDD